METITLYYSLSGKLVDEDGNPLGADARPELTAGVTYRIALVPVAGASSAGTYTLSADLDFRRTNLMVQSTVTVATSSEDGTVTFDAVSTDTNGFWTKPRQPGTKLYLRVTVSAGGVERSVIDDYIYCRPGVAGSDDHPAPNEGAVTKLNGLAGQVVIKDAAGEALPAADGVIALSKAAVGLSNVQNILDNLNATAAPTATDDSTKGYAKGSRWIYDGRFYTCVDATVGAAVWTEGGGGEGDVTAAGNNTFGGANVFEQPLTVSGNAVDGLHCDDNPLDAYQAYDVNLRPYTWLDGTAASPKLTFKNYLLNLMEITFLAKSENAESSGDAMLVAKRPDGTEVARFTVAVTPTATLRTLLFDNFSGALEITRDTTDALDTLPGAIKIYALSTWRAK